MSEPVDVVISALTFRRPDHLERLLTALADQTFVGPQPRVRVLIVDNDAEGSAREMCQCHLLGSRWSLEYVIEERRGIARARNTALDHSGDSEWIAFVDDDEVPEPNWLDELLCVQRKHAADVVGGPVVPYFPESPPDWVVAGRFFDRRRYATGQRLSHVFTNNVLFRTALLSELGLRFDVEAALMGGSDRRFFQRIGMAGRTIVWADKAVVTEWIPLSRANASWLVQRSYRVGNSTSFVELDLRSRWKQWPVLLAKSVTWVAIGAGQLLAGLIGGRHRRVRGRCSAAYGIGMFVGLLGVPYEEYRRTQ